MASSTTAVVVATHNRARLLPRLVSTLEAQSVAPAEVIIVDDASSDDTWVTLEKLAGASTLAIKPMRLSENRGAATARNTGWRASECDYIAFTDDDCAPDPRWIERLSAALERADFAQGCTRPDPDQYATNLGPFSHAIGVESETGYYETCNIAYRRAVLEQITGFDEGFRFPYGEDTDLAWRAIEAGFRPTFEGDAVVLHDVVDLGYGGYLRDMRRREGLVHTLSRHPGLRERLGLTYFFRRSHAPAIASLAAGLVAAGTRRSALAWAVAAGTGAWYARECRWSTRKPRRHIDWFAVVPLRWIADLYEIGILARASARYRAIML